MFEHNAAPESRWTKISIKWYWERKLIWQRKLKSEKSQKYSEVLIKVYEEIKLGSRARFGANSNDLWLVIRGGIRCE